MADTLNLKIVLILTVGFFFASIFGSLSHRAKLSPILGYLIAGYLIGPYSPGFVADKEIAEGLAEIGVILMMFSVGMQFKLSDLLKTKKIAIPGAIAQTCIAAALGAALMIGLGWPLQAAIVFGFAIGVASTIVLVRVLSDNGLLQTSQGHVAVGWLIVEDILTIAALLLIPTLAISMDGGEFPLTNLSLSFGLILLEFILLALFLFTLGKKAIGYILGKVYDTKSHELFTLTVLTIAFVIATGSTLLLGTSIALGAFIAGIVVGQTKIRKEVTLHSTPLKDAFVVIFFLSVGMLFNPVTISTHFYLFLNVLAIILLAKPLIAFTLTMVLKYPLKTAITVAIGLSQIGEFSFILAQQAVLFNIFPSIGYDILVACALISISLNPILFTAFKKYTH